MMMIVIKVLGVQKSHLLYYFTDRCRVVRESERNLCCRHALVIMMMMMMVVVVEVLGVLEPCLLYYFTDRWRVGREEINIFFSLWNQLSVKHKQLCPEIEFELPSSFSLMITTPPLVPYCLPNGITVFAIWNNDSRKWNYTFNVTFSDPVVVARHLTTEKWRGYRSLSSIYKYYFQLKRLAL